MNLSKTYTLTIPNIQKTLKIIFAIFILSAVSQVKAQSTGSIYGSTTDAETGETLIGVNVIIVGTPNGTSSDLDGTYNLPGLKPGKYTLKFSYVSYASVIINEIQVKEGQQTRIDVQMRSQSEELDEIVISAEILKNNENSILKIQKNANEIMDAVSAELIRKNNSSDGTDVLKRMTGVAITDGKFAYIRGVSDRYNNTLLNGSSLPSTDPEKKSFSYDMFPSSLIENVMTSKTFTPDKPADFSGGLVQINTIDFPSRFFLNLSASSSYNTSTSLKSYVSYNGGKTDYLGIDDGTRDKPSIINGTKVVRGNYSDSDLKQIAASFKNNWDTNNKKAPMNTSYKLSLGEKFNLGENTFGLVGSLTYSNNSETKGYDRTSMTFDGPRYDYDGTNYNNSVLIGALINMSYKFAQNNKISLKNIYNQTTDDDIVVNSGNYEYTGQYRKTTAFRYVSRSLLSSQLIGEHVFPSLNSSAINWSFSFGTSKRDEPDARRYVYARDIAEPNEPMLFLLDQSWTTRFYGELDDQIMSFNTDFTIKPFSSKGAPSFKTGILYDKKDRKFDARIFGFKGILPYELLIASVDQIFTPENISRYMTVSEITKPSDSYESDQSILSSYIMFDAALFEKLRLIGGIRYEKSEQNLKSHTETNQLVEISPENNDLLPALNLTYALNGQINLRGAYSKTLARPEFRELAPYSYYDFLTAELVKGNTSLKRTLIDNYDLRFEYYPDLGELFAVSFFYKHFENPIEQVFIATASFESYRSYANVPNANSYGLEFEIRKSFDFITESLSDLSFIGNLSLIKSKVKVDSAHALGFASTERPMQGQSEYIMNLGLYYENSDFGLSGSVVFNKVGDRIYQVGFVNIGDIIERPRDQVDFSISKKLFNTLSLNFTAKDILHQDHLFMQKRPGRDVVETRYKKGQNYSFGISYSL